MKEEKKIVLGITGASGSIYALRLIEELAKMDITIHIVASETGKEVLKYETGQSLESFASKNIILEDSKNFFSSIASGSFKTDGMVIVPCSVSTLGSIASGISSNLLHRVAAVCLKEKRNLILAVRESPLTSIDLQNMLILSNAGATIMPLAPAFYGKQKTLEDLVNFMIGKILDNLNIENNIYERWQ